MKRRAGSWRLVGLLLSQNAVDRGVEQLPVGMDVERSAVGIALEFIEPSGLVGIVGEAIEIVAEGRVAADERALTDAVEIADCFEALDGAENIAGLQGRGGGEVELHIDEFAEHAKGELGEADAPATGVGAGQPAMGRCVEVRGRQPGHEPGAFIKNRGESRHGSVGEARQRGGRAQVKTGVPAK